MGGTPNWKETINMRNQILVTGGVGFLGYHTAKRLLKEGLEVVLVDILSSYYDRELKMRRMDDLMKQGNGRVKFFYGDVTNQEYLTRLMGESKIHSVVHLAGQPGIQSSIEDPMATYKANVLGTASVLESARRNDIQHVVYASSSSVYGTCATPAKEDQALNPLNHYAVSKVSCEMIAQAHAKQHGGTTTGLRFFTAYGPWGRPDMAIWKFARAIREGSPVTIRGAGLTRDMTYCDDVAEMILGVLRGKNQLPAHSILNVGSGKPIEVYRMVASLEEHLGKKADLKYEFHNPVEAYHTACDNAKISSIMGDLQITDFHEGVGRFVEWFNREHK